MKPSIALKAIAIILWACQGLTVVGQDPKVIFYEIVKDDSAILFFNERYHYVEKKCATFMRLAKIDSEGNVNGDFEDRGLNNSILGRGAYSNGKKNGYFELYYPTGKIFCKGNYYMGVPTGQWDFYHESGLPERTLKFIDGDILLVRLVDKKGNLKIVDGNGDFDGPVTARTNSNSVIARGKIVNGKPDGKWTATFAGTVYCKEEFINGNLVRGTFPNAKIATERNYTNKSFLKTFMLRHYSEQLEKFNIEKCSDSLLYSSDKYSYNTRTFTSTLTEQLYQTISQDVSSKNTLAYWTGDQYITVEFTHDKNGKPEGIKLLSSWGQPFVTPITNALRIVVRHRPYKKMYLHLRLGLSSPNYSFNYRYLISESSVIRPADVMY